MDAARAVIQNNKLRCDKSPQAVAAAGDKIQVVECRNEQCEVRYVVESIKRLLSQVSL